MKKKYKPTKSKKVAIWLAVLLGQLGWIYTWKYDYWKFILSVVLSFISFGLFSFVSWVWAIVDMCNKPKGFYESYYG